MTALRRPPTQHQAGETGLTKQSKAGMISGYGLLGTLLHHPAAVMQAMKNEPQELKPDEMKISDRAVT
eukprot:scaffold448718_cov20-Prasinocladus_malaysianus.AAC.1